MAFDLQRARQETPGCSQVMHFNNAGSSLPSQAVLDAMVDYLREEALTGGYEMVEKSQKALQHTHEAAARLIGCSPTEIALTESATQAWNMAFYSLSFQPGDRILTSIAEYGSNYLCYLQRAQKLGVSIEPIPNDEHGQISIDALRQMVDERVKLIAITHVPTNGGLVNPAVEVGKVAREHHILYLLDACQSVGQMPINVEAIGCDILSATGRKYLRGPRGTGFLYVRGSILDQLEPPMLDLNAATWLTSDRYELNPGMSRFESFEANMAGRVALGVAIDYAMQWGLDAIWRRIRDLSYTLRTQLSPMPGVIVHDRGVTQCGIVTFTVEGRDPGEIKQALAQQKINVTVTGRNGALLDMDERGLTSMVRASVHYYNSEEEIARFCAEIEKLI